MDDKTKIVVNTSLLHNPENKDVEIVEITKDTSVWDVIKASKNLKLRLLVLAIPIVLIFII